MPRASKPTPPEKGRIPQFTSYEEEAKWWDTHDITDYLDEFKFVEVQVSKNLGHILQIPFDSKDMRALSTCAETRSIDVITLAKQWILERLEAEIQ